ncbi:uncharacterized protein LOC108153445 [Drosophila miranda]|uniref:uncharacterized protein LOC108153445 n=1 Tax=Drosophila miranda TaxID=7229 RepID=UPI0007E830E3|nr:uncharacterized protein LOC108153445 [Drosophila miranda]XP_017138951.1 uncharacterized protein LOC108153445 [Drosophila miranda]
MCDLYVSLVKLHLDKELQLDESAKLNSHFRVSDNGLRLFVSRYNEKICLWRLLPKVWSMWVPPSMKVLTACPNNQRDYYSTILNNPWTLSSQYSVVLGQSQCLTIVKYKSLNRITLEDFKAFAQKIPQEL